MRIFIFLIAAFLMAGCSPHLPVDKNGSKFIPQVGDYKAFGNKPTSPAISTNIGGSFIFTDKQTAEENQRIAANGHARNQANPKPTLTREQKFWCPHTKQSIKDKFNCPKTAQQNQNAQQPVFGGNRDPFILPTASPQPTIGVPSGSKALDQTFATLYPNHQVLARFPVRNSVRDGTGALIRAEIFNLYLAGVGGDQSVYTPNNPIAISDATDSAARQALTLGQRRGTRILSILKRGNLLRGEQLVFLDNRKVATCRPLNRINSFGEVIWQCR